MKCNCATWKKYDEDFGQFNELAFLLDSDEELSGDVRFCPFCGRDMLLLDQDKKLKEGD